MNRYRFRLKNGRVIGPFVVDQIKEMLVKKLITGQEQVQIFPTGDWREFSSFAEFSEKVEQTQRTTKINTLDSTAKIETTKEVTKTKTKFNEFKFDKENDEKIKLYGEDDVQTGFHDVEPPAEESTAQKTKIVEKNKITQSADKTVIRSSTLKFLEEKQKQEDFDRAQKEVSERESKLAKIKELESKIDLESDGTQLIQLGQKTDEAEDEVEEIDLEVSDEVMIELNGDNQSKLKSHSEKEEAKEEKEKKKKPNIKIIAAILVALIFFFLNDDKKEEKKEAEYKPIYPHIEFPQQFEQENVAKAQELLQQGIEKLKSENFQDKNMALDDFKTSLEHSFRKNKAIGYFILTASELLPHSKDKLKDANTIFKLIQMVKEQIYMDVTVLTGVASFYYSLEKYTAVNKTIEKFIQINKPTPKLFSLYLKSCLKLGEITKAKKIYEKLNSNKNKTIDEYLSMMEYNQVQDLFNDSSTLLVEAEKKYTKSVALKIEHANLLIYAEDFSSLKNLLKEIESLKYENAPTYYAKYLEFFGLLNVSLGKHDEALQLFQKSLNIIESKSLRMKLSELDANGASKASELILESKAINYILQVEKNVKERNWELAFSNAINAKDIAPHYIKAHLALADVQIKQGYFQMAIKSLGDLQKKYADNEEVNFKLVEAYIDAYKFSEASKTLVILSASELKNSPMFTFLYGKMYFKENNFVQALKYFKEAINKNPVNEDIYFYLAKIYSRNKKFNEAKIYLQKAIDLDPSRLDFHTAYADVLYETDDVQTAIGYLREILIDNVDNPILLGEIAVYYYRSGQLKAFQETSDKLTKLPMKDKNLYDFLVKTSLMDEKFEDVLKYGKDLLKLDPGNLEMRMLFAKILIEKDKTTEALDMLRTVTDRLDTYPRVQLYKSKLYLMAGDPEKAVELAKLEIESNPALIEAYNHLGGIYKDKDDLINAELMFKTAQKIDPNNVDALVGMAFIHMKRAQYEVALDLYKKAEAKDQNNAEVRRQLGDAYRQLGQGSLAKEAYKVYLELEPNSKYKAQIEGYLKVLE